MSVKPAASLIIPTYQRRASVERLLLALTKQSLAPREFEVLIVVDGSLDGTREFLEQARVPFDLRCVWQSNQGRAAACNTGIRMANGDLVVLLDDDMEPSAGFLQAHLDAHCKEEASGMPVGVLGAAPVALPPGSPPVTRYVARKFNQHLDRLASPGHNFKMRDFYSGNFSIRRERLLQAGLFDEAFRIYGNEDLELYYRLSQAGVKFMYCPQALAYQHYEKSFAALARDEAAKGRTATLLADKHPEVLADSKLNTYREASWRWRLARSGLLSLSRRLPATPGRVIGWVDRLEQHFPNRMDLVYRFALDYFFWLGVQAGPADGAGQAYARRAAV
ncbi:MAG: glycosyltransferase family 2 protein [Omnitrophica WOR_2 bacterium]